MSLIGGGAALARVTVSGLGPHVGSLEVARPDHRRGGARPRVAERARESSVSRLLGQLVSAQAAMLLLGLLAFSNGSRGLPAYGMTAFLGGLGVTAIATLAAFGVLAMLQAAGIGDAIDDVRGLAHRSAPARLLYGRGRHARGGPATGRFPLRVLLIRARPTRIRLAGDRRECRDPAHHHRRGPLRRRSTTMRGMRCRSRLARHRRSPASSPVSRALPGWPLQCSSSRCSRWRPREPDRCADRAERAPGRSRRDGPAVALRAHAQCATLGRCARRWLRWSAPRGTRASPARSGFVLPRTTIACNRISTHAEAAALARHSYQEYVRMIVDSMWAEPLVLGGGARAFAGVGRSISTSVTAGQWSSCPISATGTSPRARRSGFGLHLSTVMAPVVSPGITEMVALSRQRKGLEIFTVRQAARGLFRALRRGRTVALMLDVPEAGPTVVVPFCGGPVRCSAVPARSPRPPGGDPPGDLPARRAWLGARHPPAGRPRGRRCGGDGPGRGQRRARDPRSPRTVVSVPPRLCRPVTEDPTRAAVGAASGRAERGRPRPTAWAPGRCTFVGEHVDYAGGQVLCIAVDRGIAAAVEPQRNRSLAGRQRWSRPSHVWTPSPPGTLADRVLAPSCRAPQPRVLGAHHGGRVSPRPFPPGSGSPPQRRYIAVTTPRSFGCRARR